MKHTIRPEYAHPNTRPRPCKTCGAILVTPIHPPCEHDTTCDSCGGQMYRRTGLCLRCYRAELPYRRMKERVESLKELILNEEVDPFPTDRIGEYHFRTLILRSVKRDARSAVRWARRAGLIK